MKIIIIAISILMSVSAFAKLGVTTIECNSEVIDLSIEYKNNFTNHKVEINGEHFELNEYKSGHSSFSIGSDDFTLEIPVRRGSGFPPKRFATELEFDGNTFEVDCEYDAGVLFWNL